MKNENEEHDDITQEGLNKVRDKAKPHLNEADLEHVETPTEPGSARQKARDFIKSYLTKNPGKT